MMQNKFDKIPPVISDNIISQKLAGLKELFHNAKDPVAVLLQEIDNEKIKESITPELLEGIKTKLADLSFDNEDDFANKVVDIARPIWEITQKGKEDLFKQENREMFTEEDVKKTAEVIKNNLAQKIYIIGNVGSGKSTFARELAQETNFKNIDLDHFFQIFRQENNREADLAELLKYVINREQPPYIINHADLLRQDLAGEADSIILLTPKIEEQLKSREIRGENGAEGEWMNVNSDDYEKINKENSDNLSKMKGEIVYQNDKSGTIVKLVEK